MELFFIVSVVLSLICILYLVFQQKKLSKDVIGLNNKNEELLESIEKYVEIFNEQNITSLIGENEQNINQIADEKIQSIKEEYKNKLSKQNSNLTEEHLMLIDFVTLTLSLLIKTPPNLREKLINKNTDNEMIRQILKSKLPTIRDHYIPVSILESALEER